MDVCHLKTVGGVCAIYFDEIGIVKFDLPSHKLETENQNMNKKIADDNVLNLSILLVKYFEGVNVDFTGIKLSFKNFSTFSKAVSDVVQSIPYGHIMSYGDVAAKVGKPGAARAVGRVMASNPLPILIPCHRVVSSNGLMTGYSAEGGVRKKEVLLKMEGLSFAKNHRILMQ